MATPFKCSRCPNRSTSGCKLFSCPRSSSGSTFSCKLSPRIAARRERSLRRMRFSVRTWYAAKSKEPAGRWRFKGRMIFKAVGTMLLQLPERKLGGEGWGRAAKQERSLPGPFHCPVFWSVRIHSRSWRHDDVNGDVFAFVRTILDRSLCAHGELAFDLRLVIDHEFNGADILVFRHLHGEFCISYRGDLSGQGLVVGCGFCVACRQDEVRCGPGRDREAE